MLWGIGDTRRFTTGSL